MDLKKINKHLFVYAGIIIAVILIVIVVLMFMGGGTKYNYEQAEKKLREAGIEYFEDNDSLLPQTEGEQISVSAYTLEEGNYIGKLQDLIESDAICTGEVKVTKNGDNYLYTAYLNCGEDYVTSELYKLITAEGNIVTIGDGLYAMNDEYVFRGENVKNYIKFADKLWRIIKVDKENDIKLLLDGHEQSQIWDDRYNVDKLYASGINNYVNNNKPSRIKSYLDSLYNGDEYFAEDDKGSIVFKDICVGKRKNDSSVNDGSVECSKILEGQPISMLEAYEYINASLDENCKKTDAVSCQNYNYLASYERSWWSLTADAETTHRVYKFTDDGLDLSSASSMGSVKPVIYLDSYVMFDSGDGTAENPYIIK